MKNNRLTAIEIIRQAWNSQYQARTRFYGQDEIQAFEKAKKLTTACLRYNPELSEIAPYPGEFEVEEFKIVRRKVDEVDNIYAMVK